MDSRSALEQRKPTLSMPTGKKGWKEATGIGGSGKEFGSADYENVGSLF
ncbi:hypothetical protein [Leptospira fainei]|nr:hypothetical protein [Leptospira fainei]